MKTNLNTHLSTHRNTHKTIKTDKNLSMKTLPYSLHERYTNSSYGHTNAVNPAFHLDVKLAISNSQHL